MTAIATAFPLPGESPEEETAAQYTCRSPLAKENGSPLEVSPNQPPPVNGDLPEPPIEQHSVTSAALAVLITALILPCYMLAQFASVLHVGFGLWFVEAVVFLGIGWVVVRFSGRNPARYTALDTPALRPIAFGFIVGTVNFAAAVIPIQFIATSIAPEWLTRQFDSVRVFQSQSGLDLLILITAVGLAAPVAEEFFFRGVLQRGLMKKDQQSGWLTPTAAIVSTGFIFSAFHLDPVGLVARWELGVLFGYLAWRTGSIWPGIGAHAANNLIATGLYFLARDKAAEQEQGWTAVLAFAVVGIPLLAAVLVAPRRFTSLLAYPKPATDEATEPPLPLFRIAAPWIVGAAFSLGLVFALDWRGIQLNWIDMVKQPLEALPKNASESERLSRDALLPVRSKARAGELTIAFYAEQRRKVATGKKSVAAVPRADSASGFAQNEEAVEVILEAESATAAEALRTTADALGKMVAAERLGELDGVEVDGRRVVLHLYGRDADDLLTAARRVLSAAGVKEGGVHVRRGPLGTKPSDEPL